jgi:hypothetical protein
MTTRLITAPRGVTVIECGDCEGGTFAPVSLNSREWTCDQCDHDITDDDIAGHLDDGEHLTRTYIAVGEVRLAWTTRPDNCSTCGSANEHHFSVRVGDDMPSNLIPCPESE